MTKKKKENSGLDSDWPKKLPNTKNIVLLLLLLFIVNNVVTINSR